MINFETSLNAEQLKPVFDTEGAVLVLAGAGSGKTRVLTHRIAYLVAEKGVKPYNILAITFTNKAQREMRERLELMVDGCRDMWIATIHSMCVRILRSNINKIGYNSNFTIYTDADRDRVIKRVLDGMKLEDEKLEKNVKFHISEAKNKNMAPDEYRIANYFIKNIDVICEIMLKYEEILKASNALDFDDLLTKTYKLLTTDKDTAEYFSSKFKYIHVDEFQDVNTIQYLIVKLLSQVHKNIFAVGDDDQSIYGWRGAEIKNILNFEHDFKDAKVYKLEQNYRSSKTILNLANLIIKNNKNRKQKTLWTSNDTGEKTERFNAEDEIQEASYAASIIKNLISRGLYKAKDFAILMRINALSRAYEQEFLKYGIPYKVYGGYKFFERREIKDLSAYLRVINNPFDDEAVYRIINVPKRGIGGQTIDAITQYCGKNSLSFFDAVMDFEEIGLAAGAKSKIAAFKSLLVSLIKSNQLMPLNEFIREIINRTRFMDMFIEDSEENLNRKMNVDEFVNSIDEFCKTNPSLSLSDYLNAITLASDTDEISEGEYVSIATVHSSKGLEFPVVFIAGLDEGIFPISRAKDSESELEEERRLMYVAITRAKERLFFTRAKSRYLYGARQYTGESVFLREIFGNNNNQYVFKTEAGAAGGGKAAAVSAYRKALQAETGIFTNPPSGNDKQFDKFNAGVKVRHAKFGEGIIISVNGEGNAKNVSIAFKGIGIKWFSLAIAPLEIVN